MPEISMEDSYDEYPRIEAAFQARLDESLHPVGPASLLDIVSGFGLHEGSLAVDVGCGEGEDAASLATRFGFHVLAVDPVARHVALAQEAALDAGVSDRVGVARARAERLPMAGGSADLVWCKEVLMHADLRQAFAELERVLAPRGHVLVHQVLTGPRMTDPEAQELWSTLGASSVRPADIEDAVRGAGLVVRERIDVGSEWGELRQERDGAGGRRLLHAARLLRDPDRYRSEFGETAYRIMLGDCLWHVYRMIGKLHGATFVIAKPTSSSTETPPR